MENELMKLVARVAFIAIVAGIVASGLDKKEDKRETRLAAMPHGNEWVTGIVDGPSAQRSWYAPAVVMQ